MVKAMERKKIEREISNIAGTLTEEEQGDLVRFVQALKKKRAKNVAGKIGRAVTV